MNEEREVCRFCRSTVIYDSVAKRWYRVTQDGRRFYCCPDDALPARGQHIPVGTAFDT